jgi:hypothetical protein
MKRLLSLKALTIASLILVLSGCITAPIYNVIDHPISHESGTSLTMKQISEAIFKAGSKMGWTMVHTSPDRIRATHIKKQYKAVIDINFDKKYYSIDYAHSTNLGYDGINIHRNYNNWIVRLSNEINRKLIDEFIEEYHKK